MNEQHLILTRSQEIRGMPLEEDRESVNEDEYEVPEGTPVSNVWLEPIVVDILFEVESLDQHSLA